MGKHTAPKVGSSGPRTAESFGQSTQGRRNFNKEDKTPLEKELIALERDRQARLEAAKRKQANKGYLPPHLRNMFAVPPVPAKRQTAPVYTSRVRQELPKRPQEQPNEVEQAFIDVLLSTLGLLWFQEGFIHLHELLLPATHARAVEAMWAYVNACVIAWQEAKQEYLLKLQNLGQHGKVVFDGEPLLGHFFKATEYHLWRAVERALEEVDPARIADLAEEQPNLFNEEGPLSHLSGFAQLPVSDEEEEDEAWTDTEDEAWSDEEDLA